MKQHDALAYVGQLRDHLAAHDRPVAFLFGAGTSSAVNATGELLPTPLVPAIVGMTAECKKAVESGGQREATAWAKLTAECLELKQSANIENILSRIRIKLSAVTGSDKINGLTNSEWASIDSIVRMKIAKLANPDSSLFPKALPHHDFARWVRNIARKQSVEVFTTNYDILFERSFDHLRVPHFDGFIGSQNAYFSATSIEDDNALPPASWLRYWKLHGSVSWSMEQVDGESRITRRGPNDTGEMILPSHHKYDESRKQPYRSLMDRLTRVLSREDSLLLTCGYSFGDQHINAIILDALEQHPRAHLISTSYSDISEDHPVAKWASTRSNIQHLGPNAAVIAERFGTWAVPGKPDAQLAEATGGLVQADTKDPTRVRAAAGNFSAFASFLRGIQGGES